MGYVFTQQSLAAKIAPEFSGDRLPKQVQVLLDFDWPYRSGDNGRHNVKAKRKLEGRRRQGHGMVSADLIDPLNSLKGGHRCRRVFVTRSADRTGSQDARVEDASDYYGCTLAAAAQQFDENLLFK